MKKKSQNKRKQPGEKKLNNRMKLFVVEYLIDLNATQAAIRAGYSEKTAASIGQRLLKNVEIKKAIEEAMNARIKKGEITAEYVLSSLVELTERCMQRKPVMIWDHENKKLVQEVDDDGNHVWQFDSSGANKALKSLGEHLGLFKKVIAGDKDAPLFPGIVITRAEPSKTPPSDSE